MNVFINHNPEGVAEWFRVVLVFGVVASIVSVVVVAAWRVARAAADARDRTERDPGVADHVGTRDQQRSRSEV